MRCFVLYVPDRTGSDDNSGIFRAAENPPQDWKDGLFEWCGSRISKLFFNLAAAGECVETAGIYRVSEL